MRCRRLRRPAAAVQAAAGDSDGKANELRSCSQDSILALALSVGLLAGACGSPHEPSRPKGERAEAMAGAACGAAPQARAEPGNERAWPDCRRNGSKTCATCLPDEQERFMQNNESFQSLSAVRQAQIRQNLQKWNRLCAGAEGAHSRDRTDARARIRPSSASIFATTLSEAGANAAGAPPAGDRSLAPAAGNDSRRAASRAARSAIHGGLSPDEQSVVRDLNSMGAAPPQEPAARACAVNRVPFRAFSDSF